MTLVVESAPRAPGGPSDLVAEVEARVDSACHRRSEAVAQVATDAVSRRELYALVVKR